MISFGNKLYSLRKEKGISQDELAIAVNSTKSTISKYERNVVDPTLEAAKRIADYFNVSLDWLAMDTSSPVPDLKEYSELIKEALNSGISYQNMHDAITFMRNLKN